MRALVLVLLMLLAPHALAHKPSDSYLRLTPTDGGFTGDWRIALRDLEPALGLDRDGDRKITWGEVRTRHADIARYALDRLAISASETPCAIRAGTQLVEELSDGVYTVLPLVVSCEREGGASALDYSLLFDIDATHRGLITLRGPGAPQTFALSPQNPRATLAVGASRPIRQFIEMTREGIWHIWIGFDHILFLLALLLPAGLRATRARDLHASAGWRPMVKEVLVLVTAFTAAHSITLSLATLDIVSLPPRLIETAIALSVVVAGLRMRYALARPAASIAFGFGLIHGFGFANVLADLQLPAGSLAAALFAFNAGVELGQCAIVLLAVPLIRYAGRYEPYERVFIPVAATLIAAVGVAWSLERGAGVSIGL